MTTSKTSNAVKAPRPVDFGEPSAFDLGHFKGIGTIAVPAAAAKRILAAGQDAFDLSNGVQFYFNDTPAVARIGDTVEDVHQDWLKRRNAYQRAAGIA